MRGLTRLAALACAALAPWTAGASGLPDPATVAAARAAVVRVQARDCADGVDRNGTGFLYQASDRVVTALHVVAGCGRLGVFHEESGETLGAALARSLAPSDLALLALERPAAHAPLDSHDRPLAVHDRMLAIGYAIGQPTMSDAELRLASGRNRLRDMLNDEARRAVAAAGAPSLDLEILRIDGHLLPGLSGAPLIDAAGRVVGVGDGGLEGGTVSISWGVPAAELARLLEAPADAPPQMALRAGPLFAAEASAGAEAGVAVRCGERSFRKLRTRPFEALAETTDSPLTIAQFAIAMAQAGIDPSGFSYDIYVEERSGAAVAIPAGWEVAANAAGHCVAEGDATPTEIRFLGQSVTDLWDAEAKVQAFEAMALDHGAYVGHLDYDWSYPSAYVRPDGLIVNRKSAALEPVGFSGAAPGYGMETLLVREDLFVGVVAYDRTTCRFQPYGPGCDPARPVPLEFVQAALGAALSTMPCGSALDPGFAAALAGPAAQAWPNALCTGG